MTNGDRELAEIHRAIMGAASPSEVLDQILDVTTALTGARLAVLVLADPSDPLAGATVRKVLPGPLERLQDFSSPLDERLGARLEARLALLPRERLATFPVHVSGAVRGALGVVHGAPLNGAGPTVSALAGSAGLCLEIAECRDDHAGSKKAYQDAREQVRMRDSFVAIASHELRNPISALRLQLQLLDRLVRAQGDSPLAARLERGLRRAVNQCDHLVRISDTLLDTSLIASSRLQLRRGELDLSRLVEETVSRHHGELLHARCEPRLRLQPDVRAHADGIRLALVLTNLLTNAIKYAPGKPVDIVLRADGREAWLQIHDHGPGISEPDRQRIFERFERGDSEWSVAGWGIGLYLSRRIIEAHGGSISVKSPADGGASFEIVLPLGLPEAPGEAHDG